MEQQATTSNLQSIAASFAQNLTCKQQQAAARNRK
jgi:hypothetical protein